MLTATTPAIWSGNGTSSDYAYNPLNRRLTNLAARTKSARKIMDMSYGYDAVGNVKALANAAALPSGQSNLKGGASSYAFGYDDLYQLTAATGQFDKPNNPSQKFTDAFTYDSIHNMTRKTQRTFSQLANGTQLPNVAFTYDWTYAYASSRPHAATQIGTHAYLYDANGNQAGWNDLNTPQTRRISWDEENRMQQVNDNGALTQFKYDDTSNRIVKRGGVGLETVYVNSWYTAGPGRNQKHVFAGATRIADKLELPPTGSGQGGGASNLAEVDQYFYHQDHLGSTGYVTGFDGEVYQHLEYFPFGEQWVNEVVDNSRVRYRFTGKEWDSETSLYYFGARYYDPRTSVWQSPDPALASYLGQKGIQDPRNFALNSYAGNSPIFFVDPTGLAKICASSSGSDAPSCVLVDANGDGNSQDNDLSEAQIKSFSSAYRDFILRNNGADLGKKGAVVIAKGKNQEDDERMARVASQFVGANLPKGWGNMIFWLGTRRQLDISSGGDTAAETQKTRYYYSSSENKRLAGQLKSEIYNVLFNVEWEGHRTNPSEIARTMFHEYLHRDDEFGSIVGSTPEHIALAAEAVRRLKASGLAGGGCQAVGSTWFGFGGPVYPGCQ